MLELNVGDIVKFANHEKAFVIDEILTVLAGGQMQEMFGDGYALVIGQGELEFVTPDTEFVVWE